jgi:uncharacterized membrane protein
MGTGRLEAFSDGVLAIIITIMVLEMKVPHGGDIATLIPIAPVFLSYVLSFVYIGIYWVNHHHLFQASEVTTGPVLWSNLHLLFWLSLIPFSTGWMDENHFAALPVALYGFNLLMCGGAYFILARVLVAAHGTNSVVAKAIGRDRKGLISLVIYATSIGIAFWMPIIAMALYVCVALIWFIPDKRIERVMGAKIE